MTEIPATAPTSVRSLAPARLPRRKSGIGALVAAVFRSIGDAYGMAYAAPYRPRGRKPRAVPDEDLQGRDPDW